MYIYGSFDGDRSGLGSPEKETAMALTVQASLMNLSNYKVEISKTPYPTLALSVR